MANKLLVADSAEDKILELDVEKVSLVMDTFSKANMYLESDTKQGYIKLNAPGLYNFQLPECVRDGVTQNQDDSMSDNWTKEEVNEINLIRTQDVKQLGQLQRDATKGELCMLLPIEVNLLLYPDSIGNIEQPKERQSNPTTIDSAITLGQSDDVEYSSQTTLMDTHIRNANHIQRLHTKEQREVCQFLVPKLNLNFRLTLEIGELDNRDEHPNEDLELAD